MREVKLHLVQTQERTGNGHRQVSIEEVNALQGKGGIEIKPSTK